MNKKISTAAIIIVVLALFCGWYIYNRNEIVTKNELKDRITQGSTIEMSKVTPFAWDRFYVFEAYANNEHINNVLGFETTLEGPGNDQLQLLVFVKDKKLVSDFIFSRYAPEGDFVLEKSYTPNEAIFIVKDGKLIGK